MRSYATIQDAMSMGSGVERQFHCGSPDHHDRNASASVNSITGAFICYSCGWCGRIDPDNYEIDQSMVARELSKLVTALESDDRVLTESWLSQFDAAGPGEYWLSRFSEATCRQFRLGMDFQRNAATIPVRSLNGVPLGVIRRDLTGEGPKYKYPANHDISDYLFAYHLCTQDVIVLTEGATDAIAAWEADFQAMAIYGSHMSKHQRDAIVRYNPKGLILAFDQDDAGHRAAANVASYFPQYHVERPTWGLHKDLASMSVALRTIVLQIAEKNILSRLAQSSPTVLGYETCESSRAPTPSSNQPSASTTSPALNQPRLRIARSLRRSGS